MAPSSVSEFPKKRRCVVVYNCHISIRLLIFVRSKDTVTMHYVGQTLDGIKVGQIAYAPQSDAPTLTLLLASVDVLLWTWIRL